jgi:hypothetical protein
VLSGGLAGLGVLTRENYLVLLLPLCLLVWTARPRWSLRALAAPALLVAVAVGVVAPWTVRNYAKFHEVIPVSTVDGFILGGVYNDVSQHSAKFPAAFVPPSAVPKLQPHFADRSLNEAELSSALQHEAFTYLGDHKRYFGEVVVWNVARLFDLSGFRFAHVVGRSIGYSDRLSDLNVVSFWALAAVAVVGFRRRDAGRAPLALWLTPVVFAATTIVVLGTYRYRLPIEPFVVLLAALSITAFLDRRRRAAT